MPLLNNDAEAAGNTSASPPRRLPRPRGSGGSAPALPSGDRSSEFDELFAAAAPTPTKQKQGKPAPTYDRNNITKLTPMPMPEGPTTRITNTGGFSGSTYYPPTVQPLSPKEIEAAKPKVKQKQRKSYEMSWDDYEKLTERQRAAVDFNTLLIQAREKDLNTEYKSSPEQKEIYKKAVSNMFGETGGSQVYAPETLAVLEQLEYKPEEGVEKGDDLDDFLGLKVVIKEKDLANFDLPVAEPVTILETPEFQAPTRGLEVQTTLTESTMKLEETLARGNRMLQDFASSAALQRNEDLQYFGGLANEVQAAPGFGNRPIDKYFKDAFTALAMKENDPQIDAIWGNIETTLRPEEREAFMSYVDTRTGRAEEYELNLGKGKGFRSPEEFRQLLGLDKQEDQR